ncbi:MAG TPA: tetratricopeptide repeat protein [Herpetosiphonaceae bacterium]
MESPSIYLPMDRRQALAGGHELPEHTRGAVLFADISGFTLLTEALARELGPRRGAEELTHQINQVYDGLVAEVDRLGGSIVGFSGDAITCWFDGDDGLRATACALAMQRTIDQLEEIRSPGGQRIALALKAAVAAGPVRRFTVGDPAIQVADVLAGESLARMAAAENLARRGEVVLTAETAAALGKRAEIEEWRGEGPGRIAIVDRLRVAVRAAPWPALEPGSLGIEQIRPWLLPSVYQRLQLGQGEFLAELRPAVAMFIHFGGIDYDRDPAAGSTLDAYVRWVQGILARYAGNLIQITIGDKGSYLYAAFGAPIAHEDDALRAASCALELRAPPPELRAITRTSIGISQGQMRAGAYGGATRRTYGILGDDVNLAARLMQHAADGQILVSQRCRQALAEHFALEELPALRVKGKAKPVVVYSLGEARRQQSLRVQRYALPLVGRQDELAAARERLGLARAGRGQIIGVTGEAGMGKSRLVAECTGAAVADGFAVYGGAGQSYGAATPYLIWQPLLQGFFGLEQGMSLERQIERLERQVAAINPALRARVPLLGTALNLAIPETALTGSLDAKLRKASLEALIVDCLRDATRRAPLLLVFEDSHWIDPLSRDLLEAVARASSDVPLALLLAYRPLAAEQSQPLALAGLPHAAEIILTDLSAAEASELIGLKLRAFAASAAAFPPEFLEQILARAQGNPFYIEELLNYLHDQGFDAGDPQALAGLELPASLHSLILGRIDQLSEQQKITLKVASILGRSFRTDWLWGYYPQLGDREQLRRDLRLLSALDLTPLDTPEPDEAYMFKHIVTQEVAYESLAYATRAALHEQFAAFLERSAQAGGQQEVDLLAYHYGRSQNQAKQREYLRKAAEAAQGAYANQAAIDYYRRLLDLLDEPGQLETLAEIGTLLIRAGAWAESGATYERALLLADRLGDRAARMRCLQSLATLQIKQGRYPEALERATAARHLAAKLGDPAGIAEALYSLATIAGYQGRYQPASAYYEECLALRRRINDPAAVAVSLQGQASVSYFQGDFAAAQRLMEESLAMRRQLEDKPGIATSLGALASVALSRGDYGRARDFTEESLILEREMGNKAGIAFALHSLASIAEAQGESERAGALYLESLALRRELGNRLGMANSLLKLGEIARAGGDYARAQDWYNESLAIFSELGNRSNIAWLLHNLGYVQSHQGRDGSARQLFAAGLEMFRELEDKSGVASCLAGVAGILGRADAADSRLRGARLLGAAEALLDALGAPLDAADRQDYEQTVALLERSLAPKALREARAVGRALAPEQAIALASAPPE